MKTRYAMVAMVAGLMLAVSGAGCPAAEDALQRGVCGMTAIRCSAVEHFAHVAVMHGDRPTILDDGMCTKPPHRMKPLHDGRGDVNREGHVEGTANRCREFVIVQEGIVRGEADELPLAPSPREPVHRLGQGEKIEAAPAEMSD